MKTRNIFTAIVAALTLIVTGCQKEADHFLNEIKVSTSYLSFQPQGGTADITITAVDTWDIKDLPEWLTASAMSGSAGESTVKFTANEAEETREATFYIECAGAQQNINVIQMTEKVERQITPIGKVIEAGAGTFRIKGTIIKITSTSYGNFWMNDGTAEGDGIQVYGTLNKKGNTYDKNNPKMENLNCKDNPDAWDVAPGDIITVEGPFAWYNTTPELVDVTVIEIEKSLIGVESVENNAEFPLEGGEIKVTLMNKGDGFHVAIPDEAKDWLSISDFGKDYVVLRAQPNPGGDRGTTVTFTTEKDGVTYSCAQALTQKGAILEVPVADFLAAEVGDTQFRLTGVIISNYEADTQGQSFTIRDWSGEVLVYRLNDYKASGATVGDIITVVGKRGAYKENPQMVSGVYESHIATVKGKTLAEIAAAADDANVYYLATGTVKEIAGEAYGNVWLSDDSGDLYVYGCYPGWGATGDNRKGMIAKAGIKVGDKLTVIGVKSTHNDAPQIANGVYFSHESGEDPGPGPEPPQENTSVTDFIALDDAAEGECQGIVAAVGKNGVVVTDGKSNLYVFKPATTPAVGDEVQVKGTKTTYYNLIETGQGAEVTVVSSGNSAPETTPVDITSTFDAYPDDVHSSDLLKVKGTVVISGDYANFNVPGAEKRQGSLQGLDVKSYDGQEVTLYGYYAGTSGSGGKYLVIIVTKVEAGASGPASITIDGDFSDWEGIEGVSNGSHGMFKAASDDKNLYFYTWRTTEGRFSELWGVEKGYIYFAFDLDGNAENGVSLNGNGPYDFIGYIYCFGGTAEAPVIEITHAGDCAPSGYTVDNVVVKGKVDSNGAYVEYSIPRADLPAIPNSPITITSWGNKDLSKVQLTASL